MAHFRIMSNIECLTLLLVMVKIEYMETVTPEQKQPIIKSLAVAGLVAVIIFVAWLAVQIVHVLPTAADSLASLANSVYNYDPANKADLELSASQTMVTTGESFTISWKEPKMNGTYAFSYTCLEGIELDLTTLSSNFSNTECNKSYELGNDTSVKLTINANKSRFTEVFYTIHFFKTNATAPTGTYEGKVTVVNANLFAEAATATTTAQVIDAEQDTSTTPTEPVVPEKPIAEVVKPKPVPEDPPITTPIAPAPVTEPEYIYEIPLSQRDGEPDLLVSFISLGVIDDNGTFIKNDTLIEGATGALQVSVHNIGNKTSDNWTFSATLPGNLEFSSDEQKPLLPNERSLLTLRFKELTEISVQPYQVSVTTKDDKNLNNNTISGNALVVAR
jgi:hypothetical protein